MKTKDVEIRDATIEDFKSIAKLWRDTADLHANLDPIYTPLDDAGDIFRNYLNKLSRDNENSHILVAIEQKRDLIVGYCLAEISQYPPVFKKKCYGTINDITVLESFRRHHIGKQLFLRTKEWFEKKKIDRIELRVLVSNIDSYHFWNSMGFQVFAHSMALNLNLN